MMRPTWSAVATRTRLILLLLTVGLLLGNAGAVYSQDTQCSDIVNLQYGKCMSYTYDKQPYFLCNGPYSLCTIADCIPNPPPPGGKQTVSAKCQCKVVESGLSILAPPQSGQITTTSVEVSNFSYAQFPLTPQRCGTAPVVNCLNATCTVTPGSTTSTCTCPVINDNPVPGQEIFYQPGTTPPSCNTLRSGAPLKQPDKPSAKELDYALTAAMNCVMLQPPPPSNPGR